MLIIHPPLTKPCEPPAALAYLAAALTAHGHECSICDMNIEALEYIFRTASPTGDTWTDRAVRHLDTNIARLRDRSTYTNFDRYSRAVSDLDRVLAMAGKPFNLQLSLANYQDNARSPVRSADLRQAAADYRTNIFFPYFSRRLDELIAEKDCSRIGFSLSYLSQALTTFAMIGYLRDHHPEKTIILGGGLVTSWLSNPGWRNPFTDLIDHFIAGQGEKPLLLLLGIEQRHTRPEPVFTGLAGNRYLSPGFILPYAASSGCFWKKCNFCPEQSENNPYSQVAPQTAIDHLRHLTTATSPVLIHLLDNAVSPAMLRALCENPPGAPWYGFVRIDRLLENRDFCRRLRESGCVMLKLGLESGDQEVLNRMNKGIDLGQAARVLGNLHEAGIATYVYLLFGTPAETRAEADRTRQFVEEHHQAIDFLNLAIFNLPIGGVDSLGSTGDVSGIDMGGTEMGHLTVTDFYEGDLSLYRNFIHPRGWNRPEIRRFLAAEFKRSPKIAQILRNDPPLFTSNHAPFMR
ncbi:MAG: radical SAM protein [Desulfobacterales bacterium GWB2_56_26]|nr:MAG: radical SAM protein [Desulfobacterales bacterium GWB2_56_26]